MDANLAKLLGSGMGAPPSSQAVVEFKAGRMNYDGKRVTAVKTRGTIKVVKDPQGILQFQWSEAGSNNPFQSMMIFPGDAKFEKVKQTKDRVYILQFLQGNKIRHFFWMQEKDEEEDAERCRKLNNVINGRDPDAMEVESSAPVPAPTNEGPQVRAPPTSQPPNPGIADNNDLMSQFFAHESMNKFIEEAKGNQQEGVPLSSVFTSESINKVLEDEKVNERLHEYCPEGQKDDEGVRQNLHSPQLRHVLSSLQNAIETGQGHILLTQMGIDPNNPGLC